MRILYDSKQLLYKDPFGTLTPGQSCTLHIHVPTQVGAVGAECLFCREDGTAAFGVPMTCVRRKGVYDVFEGSFRIRDAGLYFYYFRIRKESGGFRLFKYGDDTNMEAGDLWQVSCIPADFTTPDWAKGAIIYQVFPDRFCKLGDCDLTGKLMPYRVHAQWDEEVDYLPNDEGLILNNDFFGGNFRGIASKMEYLASLGAQILYLNPICKSFSSHRYDTGDYKTPDPMLGTEEDFSRLCDTAHRYGIRVVLDGVFSHTGSNSLYFDKNHTFGGNGAYCTPDSPYYPWFSFRSYPDSYESWWGFDTLPTVRKTEPSFIRYIITDSDSVIAHWLSLGADGFRLDVADELPNEFLSLLKARLRELRPDALLIGEVWEDASNKTAYGIRRRYFVDKTLDSCMNYPLRTAILNFLSGKDDGSALRQTVLTIAENYPPQVLACNMNLLGSHDTPRILTALTDSFDGTRAEKAVRHLSPEQLLTAKKKLTVASFLQYMLPGAPSIYYADEAGAEGYADPFNRRTYPWGREDDFLISHYHQLGKLRRGSPSIRLGDIAFFRAQDGQLGFTRSYDGESVKIYVNLGSTPWDIPSGNLLIQRGVRQSAPAWMSVEPMGFCAVQD